MHVHDWFSLIIGSLMAVLAIANFVKNRSEVMPARERWSSNGFYGLLAMAALSRALNAPDRVEAILYCLLLTCGVLNIFWSKNKHQQPA